jgi:hypothetical protein
LSKRNYRTIFNEFVDYINFSIMPCDLGELSPQISEEDH